MKKILLSVTAMVALTAVSVEARSIRGPGFGPSHGSRSPSPRHHRVAVDQAPLEKFASVNSDQLAKEIAAGNGEMVDTLATLLKVENKALFVAKLQNNYANIYTSSDMQLSDILKNISKI